MVFWWIKCKTELLVSSLKCDKLLKIYVPLNQLRNPLEVVCGEKISNLSSKVTHGEKSAKLRCMFLPQDLAHYIFFVQCIQGQHALKPVLECYGGDFWWKKCKTELCVSSPKFGMLIKIFMFTMLMGPVSH